MPAAIILDSNLTFSQELILSLDIDFRRGRLWNIIYRIIEKILSTVSHASEWMI
jgi:hypothetical protein